MENVCGLACPQTISPPGSGTAELMAQSRGNVGLGHVERRDASSSRHLLLPPPCRVVISSLPRM
jgi:hypothetical protein